MTDSEGPEASLPIEVPENWMNLPEDEQLEFVSEVLMQIGRHHGLIPDDPSETSE